MVDTNQEIITVSPPETGSKNPEHTLSLNEANDRYNKLNKRSKQLNDKVDSLFRAVEDYDEDELNYLEKSGSVVSRDKIGSLKNSPDEVKKYYNDMINNFQHDFHRTTEPIAHEIIDAQASEGTQQWDDTQIPSILAELPEAVLDRWADSTGVEDITDVDIEVKEAMQDLHTFFRYATKNKPNIHMDLDIAPGDYPKIRTKKGTFYPPYYNIIRNSILEIIESRNSEGRVRISLFKDDSGHTVTEISDDATGYSRNMQEPVDIKDETGKVIETRPRAFIRGESERKGKGGKGLGLEMAWDSLVHKNGAKITITDKPYTSGGNNIGAVTTVTFP